jgi:hypothetical protein
MALQSGQTVVIRLRDDFPYAVRAMIDFINTDYYTVHESMETDFPTMTVLDLHIHAYLIGIKCGVSKLANLAIKRYIESGNKCLLMAAVPKSIDETPTKSLTREQAAELEQRSAAMKAFLESVAFLWKHTRDHKDVMRQATLNLIKHHYTCLMKVPFFRDLKREVKDLEKDLVASLGEDGLQVETYPARKEEKAGVRFG